ncbi:MAG TPA: flagellar hook-basal body complex protein FliE [Steroidobacter sp.]|uniref:flagellar hook-basal body complex protein FliE n=1 Tax=Steroidobacter sp. TaxID=1978227 RepID=UPI002EDAD616
MSVTPFSNSPLARSTMADAIDAVQTRIANDAASLQQSLPQPAWTQSRDPVHGFATLLERAVHDVDAQDRIAAEKMAAVDAGRSDDLVGAMLASQQASLSFSMLMQARNKIVGAMEDLIKLPL